MREILFRGKRTDCGEWVEGDLVQAFRGNQLSSCGIMPKTPTAYCWRVDPETVGQYTGLTDKNGVKIFEGDIVKAFSRYDTQHTYAITYRNGVFWFGNWNLVEFIDRFQFAEVVGNIHDNPEILKGGGDNG